MQMFWRLITRNLISDKAIYTKDLGHLRRPAPLDAGGAVRESQTVRCVLHGTAVLAHYELGPRLQMD